jgi:hypothetical protein
VPDTAQVRGVPGRDRDESTEGLSVAGTPLGSVRQEQLQPSLSTML